MELSDDQKKAKTLMDKWLNDSENIFYLFGYAGTGKSFLSLRYVKSIIDDWEKVYISSTTHPSLDVLKSQFISNGDLPLDKIRFMTLHKLLGFKPYIDHSSGEKKFKSIDGSKYLKQLEKRIVFIDECSMISHSMHKVLKNTIKMYNFKVVIMGDPAQLPPVNDVTHLSPVFNVDKNYPYQYCLTEIMRTGNILLKKICKKFRRIDLQKSIIDCLKKYVCDSFKIFKKDNLKTDKWFKLFKKLTTESKTANDIPIILTWTNNQADEYNRLIRKNLFNVKINRYCESDIVIFRGYYQSPLNSNKYYTSTVIQIKNVETYDTVDVDWTKVDVNIKHKSFLKKLNKLTPEFVVNLITFDRIYAQHKESNDAENKILTVALSSKQEYDLVMKQILKNLTSYVLSCSKDDMNKLWEFYYSNLINPYAEIIFGYSTTTHKAQSLSKPQVFVDLSDIALNHVTEEMLSCMYTAVTRVSHGLYLLI